MPVKKRTSKMRAWRITGEAVALFTKAMRTRAAFEGCARGATCPMGLKCADRCSTCLEHLDARMQLDMALRVRPWEISALDADEPAAPDYYSEEQRSFWATAYAQRVELERAVRRTKYVP